LKNAGGESPAKEWEMAHVNLSNGIEYKFVEPERVSDDDEVLDDPDEVKKWKEHYATWEREVAYLRAWLVANRPTARRTTLVVHHERS
jgi:hypothetical protein